MPGSDDSRDLHIAGYIRRSRLEQARLDLVTSTGRPSVSELAAHWQFADSSHFIRAFKTQYGQTPAGTSSPGSVDVRTSTVKAW
ncbi:helix-turn-helix domain-containing protein [Streptomyces sp. NPDC001820]|uniref:helix-turn-helix domain-containing protein n=1 Tax=Streptomyces sp. NPDC001820 TaxID=3364613 RepID=UPI0036AF729C